VRPFLVFLAACALIVEMYCTNTDMNGMPDAPRGEGKYLPILARGDGHMMYLMARSTALDFDWKYDNDLKRFGDPWIEPVTPTGRKAIVQPIGPALVWTPLIWIAEGGAVVANAFGADIPLHGYTLWHQRFVFLSSALFACGAALLGRYIARRCGLGRWAATYAGVAILLGTSLTYYATYMPSYSHATDACACAGFLAYWAKTIGRQDLRRWIVLGALLGLATLIRSQELALGIVLAVEAAHVIGRDLLARKADWRVRAILVLGGCALSALVALIVFSPQLLEWKLVFGHAIHLPQGPKYTRPGSPMILELLFAPRNGWFSTTPLAYFATLGLLFLPKRARLIAIGLGVALVMQVYLASTIVDWWGGAAFGQRRMCNVTLPLVVGLAAILWRCGRIRRIPRPVLHGVAIVLLAAPVAWNLWRVKDLKHGKAAEQALIPTCCAEVPARLRPTAKWIFDEIGNPFEFPANAWYAWRHDVPIQRWDVAVGDYPLIPPFGAFRDDNIWNERGSWNIGLPAGAPYLTGGWSSSYGLEQRPGRWTMSPSATVIVPNLMPYTQVYTVWLAPGGASNVTVRWDGDVVIKTTLHAGWTAFPFVVKNPSVGDHELTIEATPAPLPAEIQWRSPQAPVGVAVGNLELGFVRD